MIMPNTRAGNAVARVSVRQIFIHTVVCRWPLRPFSSEWRQVVFAVVFARRQWQLLRLSHFVWRRAIEALRARYTFFDRAERNSPIVGVIRIIGEFQRRRRRG